MGQTLVVATERGHDGRAIRDEGEKFYVDMEDARFKGATWFVPVDKAPPPKPKPARPPGAGPAKASGATEDGIAVPGMPLTPQPGSSDSGSF